MLSLHENDIIVLCRIERMRRRTKSHSEMGYLFHFWWSWSLSSFYHFQNCYSGYVLCLALWWQKKGFFFGKWHGICCIVSKHPFPGKYGMHTPIQESLRGKKCTMKKTSPMHITLPHRLKKCNFENLLTGEILALNQAVKW